MILNLTNVFIRNANAFVNPSKKIAVNQGGTSSSKTYSIMQLIVDICNHSKKPLLCSITSESTPHLKRGCIRDLKNILGSDWDDNSYNRTDHIYKINNSIIEFFPADESSKLRGGRRDILYMNECNNISKNCYDEAQVRTKRFTFLDFNPVEEFWAHELIGQPEVEYIHSTYQDAKNVLPKSIVESIESRKDKDHNWWRVYGLGEIGNIEGVVHPNFTQVDEMPKEGMLFYGLDFGFSNDPTSLTKNIIIGDELFSDELIYETGLDNNQIAKRMESLGVKKHYDEIFADSSEPKSISEISRYGFNIKGAIKGPDSLMAGIQKVNQYRQRWTKRSINSIKEQRNYRYIQTDDGKITNKPMDDFNHSMDSRRYAVVGKTMITKGQAMKVAF